ncbi:MAG: ATP-grasp domain-containing protein [Pseudomonadota bacterium]
MPALLNRAGFNVDAITTCSFLEESKFISNFEHSFIPQDLVKMVMQKNLDTYDCIVVCDDLTLENILNSDLSSEQKLRLLPVQNLENFTHLFSKIGLSKILSEAGVRTPEFLVAQTQDEAVSAAEKLQYPVMIKVDSSGGGRGVFECKNSGDVKKIEARFFKLPLLVQKKIKGIELDLSGFYRDGKLIYFTYSKIEKVYQNKFGPSSLRTYQQLCNIDSSVFVEMQKLGEVLGANGFVTISCIKSAIDGKKYFIEADMRPNSWVEFGKFLGDDPAPRISNWFLNGEIMQYPLPINNDYPAKLILPYYLRLSALEILFNRYSVWKYLPLHDRRLLIKVMAVEVFKLNQTFRNIKRVPTFLIKLAVPLKEDRNKIKLKFKVAYRKTRSLFG